MNKKDILNLAIKILGLYLLIVVLQRMEIASYSFVSLFQSGGFKLHVLPSVIIIIPFVIHIYIAIFLIKKSDIIVQKLNLHDDQDIAKINITKDEFQESVYSIMGIILITNALLKVLQQAVQYANHHGFYGGTFVIVEYGGFIGILIQIIIGMYLVLGSKGLVELINRLKRNKQ